jgi:hypothetical protein
MKRIRIALALGLAAAAALSFGSASQAAEPTLYANYSTSCTFVFVNDSGGAVTSVAPGTYQIAVVTPFAFSAGGAACDFVQFDMTGPGVSLQTTLGDGDAEYELHTVSLQAGSTYTVQDDARAAQTRRTFAVATTGVPSPVVAVPSTPTSSPTSTKTTSGASTSQDLVGSAILPFRGTLDALVSPTGALSLTKSKQSVDTLKSGRYTFRIVDDSHKAGFTVQLLKHSAKALSTKQFTGSRSETVSLPKGQWIFYTPSGIRHYFVVIK